MVKAISKKMGIAKRRNDTHSPKQRFLGYRRLRSGIGINAARREHDDGRLSESEGPFGRDLDINLSLFVGIAPGPEFHSRKI